LIKGGLLNDISEVAFDTGPGGCLSVPESVMAIDVRITEGSSPEPSPVYVSDVEIQTGGAAVDDVADVVMPPEPPEGWNPETASFTDDAAVLADSASSS